MLHHVERSSRGDASGGSRHLRAGTWPVFRGARYGALPFTVGEQALSGEGASLLRLQPADAASRNDSLHGRSVEALRPIASLGEAQREGRRCAASATAIAVRTDLRGAASQVSEGRLTQLHLFDECGRTDVPHARRVFVDAYGSDPHGVWCARQLL